jgi:hypothetical protein
MQCGCGATCARLGVWGAVTAGLVPDVRAALGWGCVRHGLCQGGKGKGDDTGGGVKAAQPLATRHWPPLLPAGMGLWPAAQPRPPLARTVRSLTGQAPSASPTGEVVVSFTPKAAADLESMLMLMTDT